MKRIAIFASGSGTNAENLIRFFRTSDAGKVVLVLSNRPSAGVIARAENLGIRTEVFSREQFQQSNEIVDLLRESDIDFLVLAGFLWLVPTNLLEAFPERIINVHPALLPKFGGKGMYGQHVHEAVIAAGEKKSGITIHYVNKEYDDGNVIFQVTCPVLEDDCPKSLASRIHDLEYEYFPKVVEKLLQEL